MNTDKVDFLEVELEGKTLPLSEHTRYAYSQIDNSIYFIDMIYNWIYVLDISMYSCACACACTCACACAGVCVCVCMCVRARVPLSTKMIAPR